MFSRSMEIGKEPRPVRKQKLVQKHAWRVKGKSYLDSVIVNNGSVRDAAKSTRIQTGGGAVVNSLEAHGKVTNETNLDGKRIIDSDVDWSVEIEADRELELRAIRSWVCKLDRSVSLYEVEDWLKNEGLADVRLSRLSFEFIVLEPGDVNVSMRLKNFLDTCKQKGVVEIHEWTSGFTNLRHLVWVHVFGVPLSAWKGSTFEKICANLGKVVLVSDATLDREDLSCGRVCIETDLFHLIRKFVSLKIEEFIYDVKIVEEADIEFLDVQQLGSERLESFESESSIRSEDSSENLNFSDDNSVSELSLNNFFGKDDDIIDENVGSKVLGTECSQVQKSVFINSGERDFDLSLDDTGPELDKEKQVSDGLDIRLPVGQQQSGVSRPSSGTLSDFGPTESSLVCSIQNSDPTVAGGSIVVGSVGHSQSNSDPFQFQPIIERITQAKDIDMRKKKRRQARAWNATEVSSCLNAVRVTLSDQGVVKSKGLGDQLVDGELQGRGGASEGQTSAAINLCISMEPGTHKSGSVVETFSQSALELSGEVAGKQPIEKEGEISWKVGNSLGLLVNEDKVAALELFRNWELRDRIGVGEISAGSGVINNLSINADT
ncbi:hypothetical protein OROMI_007186 [Orobanche minor]